MFCHIEFCGDRTVQTGLAEQCDDGNQLSGDGCSASCQTEHEKVILLPEAPLPPAPPVRAPLIKQPIPVRENTSLLEERLLKLLREKAVEWSSYLSLLKDYFTNAIFMELLTDARIDPAVLNDDSRIDEAILQLNRVYPGITRTQLRQRVLDDSLVLQRLHIHIDPEVLKPFGSDILREPPLDVLNALYQLINQTQKLAPDDLGTSLANIKTNISLIRDALPLFEREYGVNENEISMLIADIDAAVLAADKSNLSTVVNAVHRLMLVLERQHIDIRTGSAALSATHAAARIDRIQEELGTSDDVRTEPAIRLYVEELSDKAPAAYKNVFEKGSQAEQRQSLQQFLLQNKRISSLLLLLPAEKKSAFTEQLDALHRDIAAIGSSLDTTTTCDDSVPEALRCTNQYLEELQDAARSKSAFSRFIGRLQDFFGIGS